MFWQPGEARDTSIAVYIPEIDPATLKISSEQKIHLTETGMPPLYYANNSLPRVIALKKGQFDSDREDEIVLGYMADFEDDEGGPVFIAIYDMDPGSGTLVLKDTLSTVDLKPGLYNANNGLSRGSLFDITTGDFNQDGMDEVVVAAVTPYPDGDDFGWRLDAYIYQMNSGELTFAVQTEEPIYIEQENSGDYFRRLAVVAGNFDNGWPVSMRARDADRDGLDEVQLMVRNSLRSYSFDENMNKISRPSPVFALGLYSDRNAAFRSTFAGTDMDLAESDSLKTEIALIDERGLVIYQRVNSMGQFEVIDQQDFIVNGLVEGDFDGDALRLGPPRRQTISNVVQPLMVLSSPPVHFDIFDNEVFDLQDCYPIFEAGENCETSSVYYTRTEEKEIESTVEISSTWTKTDLPVDIGITGVTPDYLEIGDRLLNMELNKIYGGGSVERKRSSQSFTFSSRSQTTEDDNIQCLISEFELLEYPVNSGETLIRHVLLVEPSQNRSKTKIQWIPFRSNSARKFRATHEVGNILSYPKTTDLPPGARPFGHGTVSANAVFVEGSLDFEYLDNKTYEDIRSIKTTIKESSEVNISIGKINTSLIGSKTYDITPFMYWDASGALVVDYAVSPDFSAGVASWWEDKYGQDPDLTFKLPWRYSGSRGFGGSDDDLQSKQTFDIISSRINPEAGDTTDIYARIQNYSNVDVFSNVKVRFYLGDPDLGGTLIVNKDGISEAVLDQVSAREPVMARLDNWIVPASINDNSLLFAIIDEDNLIKEVHENNNKAWSLLKSGAGGITSAEDIFRDNSKHKQENQVRIFPNPVKDQAAFSYELGTETRVEISIYNLQGELIKAFPNEYWPAGSHKRSVDIRDLDQGIYLYHFTTEEFSETGRMVVIH